MVRWATGNQTVAVAVTTTNELCVTVRQAVARGERVLVCAPSNVAVDNLLEVCRGACRRSSSSYRRTTVRHHPFRRPLRRRGRRAPRQPPPPHEPIAKGKSTRGPFRGVGRVVRGDSASGRPVATSRRTSFSPVVSEEDRTKTASSLSSHAAPPPLLGDRPRSACRLRSAPTCNDFPRTPPRPPVPLRRVTTAHERPPLPPSLSALPLRPAARGARQY